ncbi:chemotaxis-specific protein-glutamate methyltransferase CheB [Vulgatibacter sp.]|uniref:chemotaxis-specific protein-glutamate methyltransferase CheB n=1 Tax=Vulgatibacter sp. TaxID=1971226 RepID=UPI003569C435
MRQPGLKTIRVLVVDDSPLIRAWICDALARQPGVTVVGTAASGEEATARTIELAPDVITMDLQMPRSDGFDGIASIMALRPTPILVLTAESVEPNAFRALSLGALDLLPKPATQEQRDFGARLAERLRLLAGTPVIRHVRGKRDRNVAVALQRQPVALVAIAASLGGPRALGQLLKALPVPYPLPVVVVQHMAEGFTAGLTRWLSHEGRREVREAEDGEPLVAGTVLVAPAGKHLTVSREAVHLDDGPPQHGFRPSATPFFHSVAKSFGARACGVVLTGMGDDGALGLKALRDAGGSTIAQDEATCAVFGMPRAAIAAGAVEQVLPLDGIAAALAEVGG